MHIDRTARQVALEWMKGILEDPERLGHYRVDERWERFRNEMIVILGWLVEEVRGRSVN